MCSTSRLYFTLNIEKMIQHHFTASLAVYLFSVLLKFEAITE